MSTHQQKRRFLINALSSSLQSVVVAATLFFLYRFLLRTIPVEHIGIWSVIFAAASIGKLAEMGISAGVVKFVATWLARDQATEAAHSIRTAATATSIGIGLSLSIAYLLSPYIIPLLVGTQHTQLAQSVLPLALVSFWLSCVASVFQSALDGCHRMGFRAALTIGTTLLHFVLCIILTPSMGLYGLGVSQIIQALVTLVATMYLLQRTLTSLGWRFFGWNTQHFRQLLAYGMNAQLASVSITLLSEPITKAFITNVGGLGFVAYYDMATRMITQLRSVVLSAFQAMVPMVSHLYEQNEEALSVLYLRAAHSITVVALPLFAAIAGFAPFISVLWIGHIEPNFISSAIILSVGWCVNTLIVPAYMINLGIGALRWNTWSHIVIGVVNSLLALVLCQQIGPLGAVVAWSIALVCGSLLLVNRFHTTHHIRLGTVVQPYMITLNIAVILCAFLVSWEFYTWHHQWSLGLLSTVMILSFCLPVIPIMLRTSIASQLRTFVGTHLANQ